MESFTAAVAEIGALLAVTLECHVRHRCSLHGFAQSMPEPVVCMSRSWRHGQQLLSFAQLPLCSDPDGPYVSAAYW